MKKTRKPMKKSAVIAIAAAAALAVLTPATAFAASRIYQARIEQTAAYQKTVHIETGDSVSDQIMALSYSWLPDGVSYAADGPYGGSIRTQTAASAALRPRSGRSTAAARTLLHRSTTPPVRLNTPPPAATLSSTSNGTAGANCGWHSPARNTLRNSTPTS